MKKLIFLVLLVVGIGSSLTLRCEEGSQSLFKATPQLRDVGTGWELGVYGGITPGQNGNFDVTSSSLPGV